ncbi:MAG: response regulator [Spirochaetota bacterium]
MGKKVLIVDDSASMRQMVNFTLSENGYEVIEAVHGKEGLHKLSDAEAGLIITDINMPEMNGIEFIKAVRTDSKYKFTPIIVLTTESEAAKQEEGKKAGATAWLVKPFTPEKLLEVARKVGG